MPRILESIGNGDELRDQGEIEEKKAAECNVG